ncbi:MAG: glycosyltransferase family 4 protein [bacterium]|nr:glycosyltransferase family 4 protein [bacterium]
MQHEPKNILYIASCVAPFGAAETGGVSRFLVNSIEALKRVGINTAVIAPTGGQDIGVPTFCVDGVFQKSASSEHRTENFTLPPNSILASMVQLAWQKQHDFDVVINLNHDWLPYYMTQYFSRPLLHVANLGHSSLATDQEIARISRVKKNHVAALTKTQARQLAIESPILLPFCIDEAKYNFQSNAGDYLAWAARIVPEKGLLNAAKIARKAGLLLKVAGSIEDPEYWQFVSRKYGQYLEYVGYLDTDALQTMLGSATAMIQTQQWEEAFGVITIESMACGTPVVAYDRGANSELVKNGVSGFLVDPDNMDEAVSSVRRAPTLNREACRTYVVERFGLDIFSSHYLRWFSQLRSSEF